MSRLADLLRRRHVARLLFSVLAGRLPEGMVPLGVVLLVRGDGGSYALAGALAGLLAIGAALGGPPLGRLMDHHGQAEVIVASAVVRGLALVALTIAGGDAPAAAAVAALACGLSTPPLEPGLRAVWVDVTADDEQAEAAYRLEAGLQELIFVLGPLVLTGLVVAVAITGALPIAAVLGVAGALAYATTPPVRGWRGAGREDTAWTAALRAPGILPVLFVAVVVGGVIGSLNVAAPAFAEQEGIAAGWLLAAYAGGGVVGGTLAAARTPKRPVESTLPLLLLGLGLVFAPVLTGPPPWPMAALLAAAGALMAPSLAASFIVVGRRALTGGLAETFAWLTSGVLGGIALGSALAGPLSEHGDGTRGFVVALSAGVIGALSWWLAGRRVPAAASPS